MGLGDLQVMWTSRGNSGVPNLETLSLACSRRCATHTAEVAFTMDYISVGVDQMQRNFAAMRKQAADGQRSKLTDITAKVVDKSFRDSVITLSRCG
jgi:hypothetical protein